MKPNALDVNQKTRLGRRVGYLQDIDPHGVGYHRKFDLMSERRRKRSEDGPNPKAPRKGDQVDGKGGGK